MSSRGWFASLLISKGAIALDLAAERIRLQEEQRKLNLEMSQESSTPQRTKSGRGRSRSDPSLLCEDGEQTETMSSSHPTAVPAAPVIQLEKAGSSMVDGDLAYLDEIEDE